LSEEKKKAEKRRGAQRKGTGIKHCPPGNQWRGLSFRFQVQSSSLEKRIENAEQKKGRNQKSSNTKPNPREPFSGFIKKKEISKEGGRGVQGQGKKRTTVSEVRNILLD